MSELETLVISIEKHSQRLIREKASLLDEKQQLEHKIKKLEMLIEQKESFINELNEKNKLKIAETLEVGNKSIDSEKKIDELVQEIEKCITLLIR